LPRVLRAPDAAARSARGAVRGSKPVLSRAAGARLGQGLAASRPPEHRICCAPAPGPERRTCRRPCYPARLQMNAQRRQDAKVSFLCALASLRDHFEARTVALVTDRNQSMINMIGAPGEPPGRFSTSP